MSLISAQISQTIEQISQSIDQLNSNLKFKADSSQITQITEVKSENISKFITDIQQINTLLNEKQGTTVQIHRFIPSDNEGLIKIYNELISKIKYNRKKKISTSFFGSSSEKDYSLTKTDTTTGEVYKYIGLNYLDYQNFNYPIINTYLTYVLGKLLCLNICFTLFDVLSNSGIYPWFTNDIINNKLKLILINNIYLTLSSNKSQTEFECLNFAIKSSKEEKINSITISIDNNENEDRPSHNISLLKFNIGLEYQEYKNDVQYERCIIETGKDYKQFDPEHFTKDKKSPSNFTIKFKISNEQNSFNNDIIFNIEHYNCTYNLIPSFRYRFTIGINGNQYILSEIDESKINIYNLSNPNKEINTY